MHLLSRHPLCIIQITFHMTWISLYIMHMLLLRSLVNIDLHFLIYKGRKAINCNWNANTKPCLVSNTNCFRRLIPFSFALKSLQWFAYHNLVFKPDRYLQKLLFANQLLLARWFILFPLCRILCCSSYQCYYINEHFSSPHIIFLLPLVKFTAMLEIFDVFHKLLYGFNLSNPYTHLHLRDALIAKIKGIYGEIIGSSS